MIANASNLLKERRLEMGLPLAEVAKKVKISVTSLEALEEGRKKDFPHEPYYSLYLKRYAQFLGLAPEKVLAFYRRDFDLSTSSVPTSIPSSAFCLTPRISFFALVALSVLVVVGFLGFQHYRFTRPPVLTVYWPASPRTAQAEYHLNGKTDPNATLRINGEPTLIDIDGSFSATITLRPGTNTVRVEAESLSEKTTSSEFQLILD